MTDPDKKLVLFVPAPTMAKGDTDTRYQSQPQDASYRVNSTSSAGVSIGHSPDMERMLAEYRRHHPDARFVDDRIGHGVVIGRSPAMLALLQNFARQRGLFAKADGGTDWNALINSLKEHNAKLASQPRHFQDTPQDHEAAHQYGQNFASGLHPQLTPHEHAALKLYKSSSYVHMNNHLRGVTNYPHNDAPHLVKEAHAAIPHIDSALHKSQLNFPGGVTLHRGVSGEYGEHLHHAIQAGVLKAGEPMADHGYTSTSLFQHHAKNFVDGQRAAHGSKYTAEFHIHAPKGTLGAHLDYTTHGHEVNHEVLLPRQRIFRVDKIEQHPHPNGGMHYVIHKTIVNHDQPALPHQPA